MKIWTWIIIILLISGLPMACQQPRQQMRIRPPVVAGSFYPGDFSVLRKNLTAALDRAETVQVNGRILGLWAPHAGYVYSGQVAANAYRCIRNSPVDAVVIVAPTHRVYFTGASVDEWDACQTPLGTVNIDRSLAADIRSAASQIHYVPQAHQQEHAVEVQIPFIQTVLPDVPVVPVVLGQMTPEDCQAVGSAITAACKNRHVLLVASSDMSHYPSYDDACEADRTMLEAVHSMNPDRLFSADRSVMARHLGGLECTLCGLEALAVVISACRNLGADQVQLLPYMNSGDVSGDHGRVVGYGAALFVRAGDHDQAEEREDKVEDIVLNPDEKKQLFRIARASIESALKRDEMPEFQIDSESLKMKRGVFVTLTNRGRLRGCIGRFDAALPLYRMVEEMAAAAAVHDTRFRYDPVTLAELGNIHIKISILSPLKKIENIDEIEIGKHGIWVKQGNRHGTYLPEVATELGWNKEEFLSHCCAEKAGLSSDAWKQGAEIYIYSSQVLDE
ncbi:AmmeMemoRadiSam system protein B [bacterium]|nr:AmmeMemoRadiSam system protein B [bacterium]